MCYLKKLLVTLLVLLLVLCQSFCLSSEKEEELKTIVNELMLVNEQLIQKSEQQSKQIETLKISVNERENLLQEQERYWTMKTIKIGCVTFGVGAMVGGAVLWKIMK